MCFFLCGARVRFSPADYALVTGLNFGGSRFDATLQHDCSRVEAYRRFCGARSMTIQSLIKRVCDLDRRVDDEDGSLYLRAVLVCVAHTLVLGLDARVQPWLWVLVDDLAAFDRFPWGAYSYKMLCHYTRETGKGEKYHFYGPSWALYVWALERVPGFGHMVAASSGDPTAHPRCLRWTFRGKPKLHGLRDLFEGQGGVMPLDPDADDLSSHYFISALTPGELSVSFRPPDNPLARGVQFPQGTGARVVEERGDEEDVPRQPRTTRSHSVRGPVRDARQHEPARHSVDPGSRPVRDARPHEPARHSVDPGKRPAPHTSSSSSGSRTVSSPSEGEVDRKWVKKTIRQEIKKAFGKFVEKLKSKGKKDRCKKSKHFRVPDSPDDDDQRRSPDPPQPRSPPQRRSPPPSASGPDASGPSVSRSCDNDPRGEEPRHPETQDYDEQWRAMNQSVQGDYTPAEQTFDWSTQVYPHWSSPFLKPQYRTETPIFFAEPLTSIAPHEWGQSSSTGQAQTEEPEPQAEPSQVLLLQHLEQPPAEQPPAEQPPAEPPRRSERVRRPSNYQRSPWVNSQMPRRVTQVCSDHYEKWMARSREGRGREIYVKASGGLREYDDFARVDNVSQQFTTGDIDLYFLSLRNRLRASADLLDDVDMNNTIILDTDWFIYLQGEWDALLEKWAASEFTPEEYHILTHGAIADGWQPRIDWLCQIRGKAVKGQELPPGHIGWMDATQVLMPVIIGHHFVLCRIRLGELVCEVYDPVFHKLSPRQQDGRVGELLPLLRLLPIVLQLARWLDDTSIDSTVAKEKYPLMTAVFAPAEVQFHQQDSVSCGPFVCMYAERLISGSPSIEWGNHNVAAYRAKIARSIFSLCETRTHRISRLGFA
ncbi:uncharacterized protein LOC130998483 [Salvia miltiorrhiza]|uniref:uncharacterized protein LOC130998483 n=1 Tax=Salvia miltiorrhiza TaxID=226208 RepID=UPI0025AC18FA|nr:uncharacterized protein LOC130998483 [Salvia miltiorrhiza]